MGVTSVNLATLPFLGSCDSTRAQMSSKQMMQSLTHPNCNIPYIISSEYRQLVHFNNMGIYIAKDDGKVIYKHADLIVLYYNTLSKIEVRYIPNFKKTTGIHASQLMFCLEINTEFKKNDIIYEYDCFRNGVPSFGYNAFTGYFNFFGLI